MTPDITFPTLSGEAPTVIGHRGASGSRPEHTLEAYRVAIEHGADVIEPDLVVTKDGHLIVRHEPMLSGTTDIADHPEFADRRTTKIIEGAPVTDWFAEDFTLAEIKTLYARERIPEVRPDNAAYNDQFRIPTLEEVIDLVKQVEAETGRQVGIIPETKHPTYFEYEGVYADGTPIHVDTSRLLIETLVEQGFTDPARVSIQSFEMANLIELQREIMPAAGIDLPLVQLMYNTYSPDVLFHLDPANAGRGADPSLFDGFAFALTKDTIAEIGGGGLYSAEAFQAMADLYAEAISPYKEDIYLQAPLATPVDHDGDGIATIGYQLTGEVVPLLDWAHDAGLEVVVYTMRDEEPFLSLNADGSVQRPVEEYVKLVQAGFDGIFTDFPGSARVVVDQMEAGAGAIALANQTGGNDILVLDPAALNAGKASAGIDTAIYGGYRELVLANGIEDAELRGDAGSTVTGNALDNRITGNAGDDILLGGKGDDILDGGAGLDILEGGRGNDRLAGGQGDDDLAGGEGDDRLLGQAGDDRLEGGAGRDILAGGAGRDILLGGKGADSFLFNSAAEGGDVIRDFGGDDRLEISAAGFGGGLEEGTLARGRFARVDADGAMPDGTTPTGRGQFLFDEGAKMLWWDVDGRGAADAVLIARLAGADLSASDILIIA